MRPIILFIKASTSFFFPAQGFIIKTVFIKVLLWLTDRSSTIFTNAEMAEDLHISVSTIGEAKKVLENDFQAIVRDYVSVKVGENLFQRIGQIVDVCAWWWGDD